MKVLHPTKERVDPAIQLAISKILQTSPGIDIIGVARQLGTAFSTVLSQDVIDNMSDHDKLQLAKHCGDMFSNGFRMGA